MSHGLLDIDKSPILAFAKNSSKKATLLTLLTLTTMSLSTGVISLTVAGVSNTEAASAQSVTTIPTSSADIQKDAANFWWNYYRRPWTQKYFGYFSPENTRNINARYGNQAQAQFNLGCRQSYYNAIGLPNWGRVAVEPFAWFLFASRQEGDKQICFLRDFD